MYSVIIPVYNGEASLKATVYSVLAQTLPPGEIIIINDCSTDTSGAIARSLAAQYPMIKVFDNPHNSGVANTRNRGFALAEGEYIALLDADDAWRVEKMALQLALMQETDCAICYTGYALYRDGVEIQQYEVPTSVQFSDLLVENVIGCSTVVLRRDIAKNYTMSAVYGHEDYVLWLTLLREGKSACGVPSVQMEYTVSPHSRSGDKRKAGRERWRIYREFLGMGVLAAAVAFLRYALRGIQKHYL